MSRFSRYDSDEERLPEGMTRVGYDADTQVYTFRDADGSFWESAPGVEYGQLYPVGDAAEPDDADTEPFLMAEQRYPRTSWRAELMPLLNFGMLVGLSLLVLFWYLHVASKPPGDGDQSTAPKKPSCLGEDVPYEIQKGDTCWDIAQDHGIEVDDIIKLNPGLDCDKLATHAQICLPEAPAAE